MTKFLLKCCFPTWNWPTLKEMRESFLVLKLSSQKNPQWFPKEPNRFQKWDTELKFKVPKCDVSHVRFNKELFWFFSFLKYFQVVQKRFFLEPLKLVWKKFEEPNILYWTKYTSVPYHIFGTFMALYLTFGTFVLWEIFWYFKNLSKEGNFRTNLWCRPCAGNFSNRPIVDFHLPRLVQHKWVGNSFQNRCWLH